MKTRKPLEKGEFEIVGEVKHPKNIQAVLDWAKKYRPDMLEALSEVLLGEKANQLSIAVMVGFEAGRMFQDANKGMELNNPIVYMVD